MANVKDDIVPSPITPQLNTYWLYVPRASIVLAVGGIVPPPVSGYIYTEAGDVLATEALDLFITES